jgi:hypothetical protein
MSLLFFLLLHYCRKITTRCAIFSQIVRGTIFIVPPGARVVMRRGEPQGRAHGGGDDRVGHLWPLRMTAEHVLRLWHCDGRGGGEGERPPRPGL